MSILTPDEIQECMTAARKVMGEGRDLEGCFAAEIEAALLKKLSTSKIETWNKRVSHNAGPHSIMAGMKAENDELRVALAYLEQAYREELDKVSTRNYELRKENQELQAKLDAKSLAADAYRKQRNRLREEIQELNLQYISDFGQLQGRKIESAVSKLYELADAMDTRAINNVTVKSSTLESFAQDLRDLLTVCTEPTEVRLWDSQWVNVVNHDNCYAFWATEDAVNHAVKMTEQLIAKNVAENNLPPKPEE